MSDCLIVELMGCLLDVIDCIIGLLVTWLTRKSIYYLFGYLVDHSTYLPAAMIEWSINLID